LGNIQHSTCSVIPPHIQRHVAQHGDADQRKRAAETLSHMALLTAGRAAVFRGVPPAAAVPHEKQRRIFDAGGETSLPGILVMTEGGKRSTDIEVREAFDGSGAVWDFFDKVFGRDSIDDRGMQLDSTVHYGLHFDNAMWNGRQMVFGDGDGKLFKRFTGDVSVIGHELTHGITQHTAALKYQGETGALNEHISDVGGIMVKQFLLNQSVTESDWIIGGDLVGPDVHGKGLRSMKAPGTAYDDPVLGKDPQPGHMRGYVHTSDDNGGVHINSGIPNHAFCLAANDLGPFSWVVAGKIWYWTLKYKLRPRSSFQDFANATVITAGEKFVFGGAVQRIVAEAWVKVGLPTPPGLMQAPASGPGRPLAGKTAAIIN
jgi:Zn-dependent metalloprotease